jgi:hypothetical protein
LDERALLCFAAVSPITGLARSTIGRGLKELRVRPIFYTAIS